MWPVGVCMLRWHAHPGGELLERLPREEVAVDAHGRRLKSGGILSGALHTLGYVRSLATLLSSREPRLVRTAVE